MRQLEGERWCLTEPACYSATVTASCLQASPLRLLSLLPTALQKLAAVLDDLDVDVSGIHMVLGDRTATDHVGRVWLDTQSSAKWSRLALCAPGKLADLA